MNVTNERYQMSVEYNKGRFNVFDVNSVMIGRIDHDEFVRNGLNLLFRIDNNEVYSMEGELLGFMNDGVATARSGKMLFRISTD